MSNASCSINSLACLEPSLVVSIPLGFPLASVGRSSVMRHPANLLHVSHIAVGNRFKLARVTVNKVVGFALSPLKREWASCGEYFFLDAVVIIAVEALCPSFKADTCVIEQWQLAKLFKSQFGHKSPVIFRARLIKKRGVGRPSFTRSRI